MLCDRLPDIHMINLLTFIITGLARLCCHGSRSPPIDFYCLVCVKKKFPSLLKKKKLAVMKMKGKQKVFETLAGYFLKEPLLRSLLSK